MASLTRWLPFRTHPERPSHRPGWWPLFRFTLLGFFALARSADAQPREVNATVIAVRENRVYLLAAPADSTALIDGARLTFQYRGKTAATGTVLRSFQDGLAVAALTSGSLGKIKKLDRIRTLAEAPLSTRPTVLRIGFPSARRPSLLFACAEPSLRPPVSPAYAESIETLQDGSSRFVGDPQLLGGWPDTLIVRRFDDAADQEIALERGDLDVGVFWPGELSPAARRNLDQGVVLTVRDRGVVLFAGAPLRVFSELNEQLFRGDLLPWPGGPGNVAPHDTLWSIAVDSTMPGHATIGRFLNRGAERPAEFRRRLTYVDRHVAWGGSVVPDSLFVLDAMPVFAIRCAVVPRRGLHALVTRLGAYHFANMNVCLPTGNPR